LVELLDISAGDMREPEAAATADGKGFPLLTLGVGVGDGALPKL